MCVCMHVCVLVAEVSHQMHWPCLPLVMYSIKPTFTSAGVLSFEVNVPLHMCTFFSLSSTKLMCSCLGNSSKHNAISTPIWPIMRDILLTDISPGSWRVYSCLDAVVCRPIILSHCYASCYVSVICVVIWHVSKLSLTKLLTSEGQRQGPVLTLLGRFLLIPIRGSVRQESVVRASRPNSWVLLDCVCRTENNRGFTTIVFWALPLLLFASWRQCNRAKYQRYLGTERNS